MSNVSVEELRKRLILRMLAKRHLGIILTDTRLIVEYAKVYYADGKPQGLYYVVLAIRNEIENLDAEIRQLKNEIIAKETEKKIDKVLEEFKEESE
jgi:uncharacterized protein YlxW (UPF0749 family)